MRHKAAEAQGLHLGVRKLAEHQSGVLIQLRIHVPDLLVPSHLAFLQAVHILRDVCLPQLDRLQQMSN